MPTRTPPARRPRLIHLACFDPTNIANGTSARGRAMLGVLVEHYEVTVVCLEGQFPARPDPEILPRLAGRHATPFTRAGYFGFSTALYRLAEQQILLRRPHLILADLDKAGLYAALLGRKYGIPFVYSSHNVEYLRFLNLARGNPLRLPFVPWAWLCERMGVRAAAATIAISKPDAVELQKLSVHSRVVGLPLAFDELQYNPVSGASGADAMTVLIVGNFGYPPNLNAARQLCRDVIPVVASRFPQVRFRFVGGEFPDDLRGPNVEVAGFVDDLVSEYRRAAIVLVPVESGGGIKIKAIEALACGCNVISTAKGMEGIDHEALDLVRVASLLEFPAAIIDALEIGPQHTERNWEKICAAFGARTQASTLMTIMTAAEVPERSPS